MFTYAITDLPPVWPGKKTPGYQRKRPLFKANWTRTLKAWERELRHLGAKQIELALELKRGAQDLRQDGMLKADARPGAAIILSFIDREGHRQAYPCDTFAWWEDNAHAIAVVLEDLRRAERYGVQSALIRAGFKALPATTAPTLTAQQAAHLIATRSEHAAVWILSDIIRARAAYRTAAARTHPDAAGGSTADFQHVQDAKRALEAHHGASL